jgi:hypothetical protein
MWLLVIFAEPTRPAIPRDRWGNTPLADAMRGDHSEVIKILNEYNATT